MEYFEHIIEVSTLLICGNSLTKLSCFLGGFLSRNTVKSYPITGLDRLIGLQEVEAPRNSRHLAHKGGKVVSRTHWPPLPLKSLSRPQGHSTTGTIM